MFSSYVLHTNKSLRNLYGDSVRLIRKRVNFFLNNKRWYEEKGVPYTLGLLLHGVPGAGKTSTIKSIAKDTNRHVLNIRLSPNTTVSQLNNLFYSSQVHVVQNGVNKMYDIPIDKRIIVLEDVDCLTDVVLERSSEECGDTPSQKETQKHTSTLEFGGLPPMDLMGGGTSDNEKVSLSTVLNILDGVLEQPGRILIMTSNHPEKLDKALLRPGRIDVIVHFDFCKKHEIKEIVEAFAEVKVSPQIEENFVEGQYTPAEVTQVIFECMEDVDEMLKRLSVPKHDPLGKVEEKVEEALRIIEAVGENALETLQPSPIAMAVAEPVVIEPVVSEPVVIEPVVSEPVVSEPVVSGPTETINDVVTEKQETFSKCMEQKYREQEEVSKAWYKRQKEIYDQRYEITLLTTTKLEEFEQFNEQSLLAYDNQAGSYLELASFR
jgi:SpoVK/Ycf46/Vps4 family AAA+-type ATPase